MVMPMTTFLQAAPLTPIRPLTAYSISPTRPYHTKNVETQRRCRRPLAPTITVSAAVPEETPVKSALKDSPPGFIIWGPPGSGKTSLCEVLSRTHDVVHISTGALLRAHVLYETEWGLKARPYVLHTTPVPDDIVIPMVIERLQHPDCRERGYLLDGFPRNPQQHTALAAAGFHYRLAILLHAPRDTLSRRIRHRRLDPETDVLYNLRLRPPASQEVLERLIVLDKDRGGNVTELFANYGRNSADTFKLVAGRALRVDADRPFDAVLQDFAAVLQREGIHCAPLVAEPPPRTAPIMVTPPDALGRASAVREAGSAQQDKPASAAAALRARRNGGDHERDDKNGDSKVPITLIRCDGYMCDRESVEESQISFRGAATEQVMLMWNSRPKTVLLLVKKDPSLMKIVLIAARHLIDVEKLNVIVEGRVQTQALANGLFLETFTSSECLHENVDLVICLGGDGLILHVSTLFKRAVPPVISFNLGSLGFLTPFFFENFAEEMKSFVNGDCNLSLRMRLCCQILHNGKVGQMFQVLNEVVVDRGASPYLSNLDCFCDGKYITTVQADGIIMSTPTGSTAYSMSAGGSMVHPSVPAILFTPICPHSLSFRPIVFPDSAQLRIQIAEDSRSHAWASFDGKSRQQLKRGDGLIVSMSLFPVPTVNKTDHTGDWFQSLDRAFNFNSRARQQPLMKDVQVPDAIVPDKETNRAQFDTKTQTDVDSRNNGLDKNSQPGSPFINDGVGQGKRL